MLLESNKVWYTAYGSNLLRERFYKYLQGGVIPGNSRVEKGAKDNTLPEAERKYLFLGKLYFCYEASKWDGSGVAFIDNKDLGSQIYGKQYLITADQFFDIVKQENATEEDFIFNEKELLINKETIIYPDRWYGRVVLLGIEDSIPMITFTSVDNPKSLPQKELIGGYRSVIEKGLKETWNLSDREIGKYLG